MTLEGVLDGMNPEGPGAAVAVVRNGEVTDFAAKGLANIEHRVPITRETVHYLASTSKQFVATSIALLEADGKLSIEDEVAGYVPEIAKLPERVCIFHVLHHTSGIRDKYALAAIGGLPEDSYATDAGTLKLLSGQRTLNFPPGSRFMYTNSGYFLLAQIVARVSGCSFREFTQARIFGPLGMRSSLFRDDPDEPLAHRASGHSRGPDGDWRLTEYRYSSLGPGGAWSTVDDLARWTAALDRDEPLAVERLLRTRPLTDGSPNPYAFGLTVGEYRGRRVQQHAGGVQGHTADFLRFPEEGVAVICFANGGASAPELSRRAADVALGLEPVTPAVERPEVSPDVETLRGTYVDGDEAGVITVEETDGNVSVRLGRLSLPVRVVGPTELAGPAGIVMTGTGAELVLRTGGGDEMRFSRVTPPSTPLSAADAGTYVSDELGVALELTSDARLSRDGSEPSALQPISDDLYIWTMSVLGQSDEIPVRVLRDAGDAATALRLSMSRALDVRFTRAGARSP